MAVPGDGSPGHPGAIQEGEGEKEDGTLLLKPIMTANEVTSLQIPDPSTSEEPEKTGIDNPSVRKFIFMKIEVCSGTKWNKIAQ